MPGGATMDGNHEPESIVGPEERGQPQKLQGRIFCLPKGQYGIYIGSRIQYAVVQRRIGSGSQKCSVLPNRM